MKIDANLRVAIRSAVKVANSNNNWQERGKLVKGAIEKLASTTRYRTRIAKAVQNLKTAEVLQEKAYDVFASIGVNPDLDHIHDEDIFVDAGGVLPVKHQELDFDKIIASLAAADAKEGAKIIKSLGINWS